MQKRFFNLLGQDIKIAMRNYFHVVVIVLALLMSAVIHFVVPSEMKLTPNEIFYDATEGQVLTSLLDELGVESERIYQGRQALVDTVTNDSGFIGIVMEGTLERAEFTIYHQGSEAAQTLNLFDASLETILASMRGEDNALPLRVLYLRDRTEPIPLNLQMIPLIIVLEAVLLGFLLIAVMVFQDKEEGGVRAYRVSPAGTLEYILSKSVVNMLLALLYSIIIIVSTIGVKVQYLPVLLLILLASFLMTSIGLAVSVFFKNLEEFLFVGVFLMSILGLPMVSYMSPSFAPRFLTILPSYAVLFGIREILFTTGKGGFILQTLLVLLVQSLLFFGIGYMAVRSRLMKEGR